ncbi:MAG: hypothetical protein IPH72_19080 [Sandaracinaceae bacterium]|nr:hypothetical protein [Sandaracinaceae bacterium]
MDLAANEDALATVSGSLQIGNAPGGSVTSVVLDPGVHVPADHRDVQARWLPGLRALEPGSAVSISGNYVIGGVRWAATPRWPRSRTTLVRDPDPGIAGTQIVSWTWRARTSL